jgi:hypothetical protein
MQVPKMDLLQLRSSGEFMDKATIVALVVAAIAIVVAGTTTWLSIKNYRAVAQGALDQHKLEVEASEHVASLEKDIAAARERGAQLEQALSEANEKAAESGKQTTRLQTEVEAAKSRSADLEKELTAAKARTEQGGTVAGKSAVATEVPASPRRQMVESLRKYAGTLASVYVVADDAPGADEAGSFVKALLAEAGWAPTIWQWSGVSGIVGVVVLTREGLDPTMDQAAVATVDALRSAGFNAAKAGWPADVNWHRVKGAFSGPQSPDATEAPVRIVIGARAH